MWIWSVNRSMTILPRGKQAGNRRRIVGGGLGTSGAGGKLVWTSVGGDSWGTTDGPWILGDRWCGLVCGDYGRTSDTGGALLPPRRLPTGRPTTFGKQALGHASPANPALTNCVRTGRRGGGVLGDTVQSGTQA